VRAKLVLLEKKVRARVARPDERTDVNDGLQILYAAEATAIGGREGHARTRVSCLE
jgi:hypothetical protein